MQIRSLTGEGRHRRYRAVAATAVVLASLGVAPHGGGHSEPRFEWLPSTIRLVDDPPEGFYSYAPSVVSEGSTTWVWSCHNDQPRVIRDHIYLTKIVNGVTVESRSVLQASAAPAWDSFHVCDPSVVAGNFRLHGDKYRYAMFYLGNDLDASAHNQVGVALAKTPEGPWIKYPEPIVTFERTDQWGAGQPSAVVTAPQSGKVQLFYTQGDTSTRAYVRQVDLSRDSGPVVGAATLITTDGLTGTDGAPDWLNGFDVALSQDKSRYYVVREQHPYPTMNPWWIGPSVQVASIDARSLLAGGGRWTVEGDINRDLTGFARNHNAGLVRTWTGGLRSATTLGVVFTDSCESLPTVDNPDWSQSTCDSLYTYDLWSIKARISPGKRG